MRRVRVMQVQLNQRSSIWILTTSCVMWRRQIIRMHHCILTTFSKLSRARKTQARKRIKRPRCNNNESFLNAEAVYEQRMLQPFNLDLVLLDRVTSQDLNNLWPIDDGLRKCNISIFNQFCNSRGHV